MVMVAADHNIAQNVGFGIIALAMVIGAIRVVTASNVVHAALWLVVVLVRGATDGWVSYPFLDPAEGYARVASSVIAIAIGVALVAAVVVASSRLGQVRRPADGATTVATRADFD